MLDTKRSECAKRLLQAKYAVASSRMIKKQFEYNLVSIRRKFIDLFVFDIFEAYEKKKDGSWMLGGINFHLFARFQIHLKTFSSSFSKQQSEEM